MNNFTPLSILKESINYKDIVQVFPHQEEVLNKYYNDLKDEKSLCIDLPTGSGKTFVFLAIAEYWRKKGKKVCVLAQTKQLTEHLKNEADRIKVKSVIIQRKNDKSSEAQANLREYNFNHAFGIINYQSFFTHEIDADIVIVDDCHLLEDSLQQEFTFSFYQNSQEYEIIKKFIVKNDIYSEEEIKSVIKEDSTRLIDFIDEQKVLSFIEKEILSKAEIGESGELYWKYYYNKKYLKNYLFFLTKDGFFITPFVSPLNSLNQFQKVEKKIFFSATILSKNQFIFSLGLEEDLKILRYLSLESCDYNKLTIGQRMILPFPSLRDYTGENPLEEYYSRLFAYILTILGKFGKATVLCQSLKELRFYKERFLERKNSFKVFTPEEKNFYEEFKNEEKAVLLLANRYSGLDFPGDTCKVLILTTIPGKCTPVESFIEDELNDTPSSEEKTAMRIVQAFGRCNRNKSDMGLYFVFPGGFYFDFNKQATFSKYYPSNITNEILQGVEIYEKDSKKDIDILSNIGETFLKNPQIFEVRKSKKEDDPKNDSENYNIQVVKAWRYILNGNYRDSKEILEYLIINKKLTDKYKCWFNYLVARCEFYLRDKKPNQDVINLMEEATKRRASPFFNKLYKNLLDIKRSTSEESPEYKYFSDKIRPQLKDIPLIISNLIPIKFSLESGDHDKICKGVTDLLKMFNINAEDISKDNNSSMDLQIKDIILNKVYLIEVKSKPGSQTISSGDIGQIKKHVGGKIAKGFGESRYILLTKKLPLEKDTEDQLEGISLQYVEDYITFIDLLISSSTNTEKFINNVLTFYQQNFSNIN